MENNNNIKNLPELKEQIEINRTPTLFIKHIKSPVGDLEVKSSDSKPVLDKYNFKIIFKTLYDYASDFDSYLLTKVEDKSIFNRSKKKLYPYLDDLIYETIKTDLPKVEVEIMNIFPDDWVRLKHNNGKTKLHIIFALMLIIAEVKLNRELISPYDENILLWAILLHDISKHVTLLPEAAEEFTEKW
jgi:hypothetical protein